MLPRKKESAYESRRLNEGFFASNKIIGPFLQTVTERREEEEKNYFMRREKETEKQREMEKGAN